jgi:hypothetical protein
MLTSDERLQIAKFEDAIAEIMDHYLVEGLDPETMASILHGQSTSGLFARRKELEEA